MAKKRYTKLEEEIIQILDDVDHEPGWRRFTRRPARRQRPSRPPGEKKRFQWSTSWLWLGSVFGLALLSIIVADWSRTLAAFLVIASILAFFSPIVLSRTASKPTPIGVQRWRGKDIELVPERSSTFERLRFRWRRWLRKWQR